MQVTLNTLKYQQNTPLSNNNKPQRQAAPSFGGSGSLIDTFTSKSTFFEPVEKAWNVSTDWIAKNIIEKAMNSKFVGNLQKKLKTVNILQTILLQQALRLVPELIFIKP